MRIFEGLAKFQRTKISFQVVANLRLPQNDHNPFKLAFKNEPGTLPTKLMGDHIRLKQVLVNLTKNALKFSQ